MRRVRDFISRLHLKRTQPVLMAIYHRQIKVTAIKRGGALEYLLDIYFCTLCAHYTCGK